MKREASKATLKRSLCPTAINGASEVIEDKAERLTLIVAICESKSPFSDTIYQAFLEKIPLGNRL